MDLINLIEDQKERIISKQKDEALYTLYRNAVMELASSPALEGVTPDSIVREAVKIVEIGLNPNPMIGEAYVLPRSIYKKDAEGKKQYAGKEAKMMISSKGYHILAHRAGWKLTAQAVFSCDDFSITYEGMDEKTKLIPNHKERDEENSKWVYQNLDGVLVFAKDPHGEIYSRFVKFAKLEKIRLKSDNQVAGKLSYIWEQWPEEMYLKSAVKYHIKRLPVDSKIIDAIVMDEAEERENTVNVLPHQNQPMVATSDTPKIIKNLGLSYYLRDNRMIIEGKTFQNAKALQEIGCSLNDNTWSIELPQSIEEKTKIFYSDSEIKKAENNGKTFLGVQSPKEDEIISSLGFTYNATRALWVRTI